MYIYVMISQTQTKFGRCIRKVGHVKYNHASISLDADFKEIYSFARPQHNALLLGQLVDESYVRFTLGEDKPTPVVVFKLPVSTDEYNWVRNYINDIKNDPEYMYNYFSVLSHPFLGGVETYKSFSCVEFVTSILKELNYPVERPCRCTPDDLLVLLKDYICFEGDIRECMNKDDSDDTYFKPMTMEVFLKSIRAVYRQLSRRVIH